MAILAYLSQRCAALRGSGMRSNCADSFSATQLQSGLRTQAALSRKSGTHCADRKSRTSVRQTERVLLRTTFAQGLRAQPLRTTFAHPLSFQYRFCSLVVRTFARSFPVLHQRGGPVLHQRGGSSAAPEGVKMAGATPPFAHFRAAPDPRMHCASRGSSAALPTGGSLPP